MLPMPVDVCDLRRSRKIDVKYASDLRTYHARLWHGRIVVVEDSLAPNDVRHVHNYVTCQKRLVSNPN